MPKIMFVDTDERVVVEWGKSPHSRGYETLPFESFVSPERTSALVMSQNPDVVVIAPTLDNVPGMKVFTHLRSQIEYPGKLIINRPQGVIDSVVRCTPEQLAVQLGWVDRSAVESRREPRYFQDLSLHRQF